MDENSINMIIALAVTILSELIAFLIFIKRLVPKSDTWLWLFLIIGINCFTNPLAQIAYSSMQLTVVANYAWIITEVAVVIIEAFLIHKAMLRSAKSSLCYSVVLNAVSILVGELLCWKNYLPWCY